MGLNICVCVSMSVATSSSEVRIFVASIFLVSSFVLGDNQERENLLNIGVNIINR